MSVESSITKAPIFPEGSNEEKPSIMKLIKFRFKQSSASRLAEYITGMRPDDSRMPDRLIEDQKILRAKYHLPPREWRRDFPSEYERILRKMAKESKTIIRSKAEYEKFFQKHSVAGLYDGATNTTYIEIDHNTSSYINDLGVLEHELVHAAQRDKNMTFELKEYEAYVAVSNNEYFKENPEEIGFVLFGYFIGKSVEVEYFEINKHTTSGPKSELTIKPIWNDPQYFLKNIDKVSQVDIDEYIKNKKLVKGKI